MGSTRGSTLRNRWIVLLALVLATASAIVAVLLARANETRRANSAISAYQ